MKHIKTYKIFESVNDDVYNKWIKAKAEWDSTVAEVKVDYLQGVSDCLYDLTDYYEYTSKVEIRDFSKSNEEYWKFIGNVVAKFEFKVPIEKIADFFDTLIELDELVKSHVSKYRRILVKDFDIGITNLHKLEIYSLEDVKTKVMNVLDERFLEWARAKRIGIKFAKIEIEI